MLWILFLRSSDDAFMEWSKNKPKQSKDDTFWTFHTKTLTKTWAKSCNCVLQISACLCNSKKTKSGKQRHSHVLGRVFPKMPNSCFISVFRETKRGSTWDIKIHSIYGQRTWEYEENSINNKIEEVKWKIEGFIMGLSSLFLDFRYILLFIFF